MTLDFEFDNSEWVDMGAGSASLQNVNGATLTCWLNVESLSGPTEQYYLYLSTNTNIAQARANLSARVAIPQYRGSGRRLDADAVSIVDSVSGFATGTLRFIAVRLDYDGQSIQIFVDGVLNNTTAVAGWVGNTSNTTSAGMSVGARADANNFADGLAMDARVYARTLSAIEIQNLFGQRGKDGNVVSIQNRYKMTEQPPGTAAAGAGLIKDSGPRKRNGTPVNTPTYATRWLIQSNRRRRRRAA